MHFKKLRFLFIGACSLLTLPALAQDKIHLVDGSVVQAKVKEVGPRNIIYTRWDNKEGADYVVVRRDVEKIVFENGTEETISRLSFRDRREMPPRGPRPNREDRPNTPVPGYGANILAIAPLQMTNESVAGVGIHYERVLDKTGIFSFYLPVAFSFFREEVTPYPTGITQKASRTFTSLYPGIKIYPAGSAHRVSYSVGPSFGLAFGNQFQEKRVIGPSGALTYTYQDASVFKAGFLINNGLNIQPSKKIYVGLELGFGIYYYNNETDDFSAGDEPMVQFNFKMGYRF